MGAVWVYTGFTYYNSLYSHPLINV